MICDYKVFNPTGNITILVESKVNPDERIALANKLLEIEKEAEQVGFISDSDDADIRLDMAGGEFCGNATMSAAAYMALKQNVGTLSKLEVIVSVSGADKPIKVTVNRENAKRFSGYVQMPMPQSISRTILPYLEKEYEFTLIKFDGISHLIYEGTLEKSMCEVAIKEWCRMLDTKGLGIMMIDINNMKLTPLVYVRNQNSLYWESSCASGTTAAGIYLGTKIKDKEFSFVEPGGILKVLLEGDKVFLGGVVELVK